MSAAPEQEAPHQVRIDGGVAAVVGERLEDGLEAQRAHPKATHSPHTIRCISEIDLH